MQIILSIIIYIVALCLAAFILFRNHQKNYKNYSVFLLLCITFAFYLYKLGNFPNIFIDEANGFYDASSLTNYGVDSHLMKMPIYFQSYAGQGQSVLLAYLAIPFLKIIGVSLFSFRLTLVILAMFVLLLSCYILDKFYPKYLCPIMLSLCTAPYVFTETKYAMDCNISLWIILLIIDCLFLGVNKKNAIVPITCFYLLCGLLAYSYNVAWIYLILFITSTSVLIYKEKILNLKPFILNLIALLIEIIPILTFAVRSNIASLNKTIRLGLFTIPALPMNRANVSFIDFHGNILKNMINNAFSGFKMLFLTSDKLTWNSLCNFNAYYSFSIIIFIIGLYWILRNTKLIESKSLLLLLFSNIPIWFIVQPNYNHWMFTHIPILLIIGVGIEKLGKVIANKYIYGMYLLFFLLFIRAYYITPRYTGFNINSIESVEYIKTISKGNNNVYFDGNDKNLLLVIRDFSKISPYKFQQTKDYPYSEKQLLFYNNLANYHKVDTVVGMKKNSLFLTTDKNFNQKRFKLKKANIYIGDTIYYLYKKI